MLKLSDFDYNLPAELIAQFPLKDRDSARLLVLDRAKNTLEHRSFKDIACYFRKNDLLILNNTKVLPCRIYGRRLSGGKVEVLLLAQRQEKIFKALLKPSRLKIGEKIIFDAERQIYGIINARDEISFNNNSFDIYDLGSMPLPPYIKRQPQDLDDIYYQTVYAEEEGAVAAPTAGLHFTIRQIEDIKGQGVKIAFITLHVGPGTFKPVKVTDIKNHKMEPEYFKITEKSAELIREAKENNNRIFCVGTTSLRALETYHSGLKQGYTDLFIYPGYKFNLADCILTNFHLPRTTLFMLVCAFAGQELIKRAYREAIGKKYRFYSYGDAMLII